MKIVHSILYAMRAIVCNAHEGENTVCSVVTQYTTVQRHSIQFYDKINGKKIANEGAVFMPWECKTVEKQRLEFVTKALETNNFSALCREYEITRKTGRKWVDRFKQGLPLTDMSRRPLCSPNKTPDDIEELIVSVRFDNPGWCL